MGFRIGLGLPIVQQVPGRAQAWEAHAGPRELVQIAQAADELGLAWITCSDHVAVPSSYAPTMGPTWYEPATTLAYLAAVTTRIELLSHVLVLPYRHPLAVAKTYATLDHLSAGRVILGVGSGHLKPEFASLGADHEHRGVVTDEYLQALRVALEDTPSSFSGERLRWRDMIVAPRAARRPRPPLWVGGNSRRAALRAAAYADGWIPWEIAVQEFTARVDDIRSARAAANVAGSFDIVAPLHIGRELDAASIAAQLDRWRTAGATAFHTGVASNDLPDLLARLQIVAHAAQLA
jgi:probable F420-dependent oxidoreductase